MSSYRPCAVLGCMDKKSTRHRFPNPKRDKNRYDEWIRICANNKLITMDPETVYNSRRVCHIHFGENDKTTNMYISRTSLPTLNIPHTTQASNLPSEEVESCITIEELDTLEEDLNLSEASGRELPVDSKPDPAASKQALKEYIGQLSISHFNKLCRACLSSEDTAFISELTYENISLGQLFKNSASVQMEDDDNLPKSICLSCIKVLVQIQTFKEQCQQSYDIVRSVITERNLVLPLPKNPQENIKEETVPNREQNYKPQIIKLET